MRKLLAIIAIATLLASCATAPYHACGITELNKQYSKRCNRQVMGSKLTNKQKRGVKRRVDLEQGVRPPHSSVFVNKKKYNRKKKHKNEEEE